MVGQTHHTKTQPKTQWKTPQLQKITVSEPCGVIQIQKQGLVEDSKALLLVKLN